MTYRSLSATSIRRSCTASDRGNERDPLFQGFDAVLLVSAWRAAPTILEDDRVDLKQKISTARTAAKTAAWLLRAKRKQLSFPARAEHLLEGFRKSRPDNEAYDDLVRYMALSWLTYRNQTGSGATFFGHPSWSGTDCDALEGFARMMPLFAAWCASGRATVISVEDQTLDLVDSYKRGLLAGTDPSASSYWGDMPGTSNQRIVEAADIALALWLMRDLIWSDFSDAEKAQIADWFAQAGGKKGLDNNWQLFFVQIDRVLTALGYPERIDNVRARYDRVKEFHVGEGWFSDGPGGHIDYYNAWGFHYALSWIDRIDPTWDAVFIRAAQTAFVAQFRYLIGPEGFPVLGRSIPYRMAVPAPLVAGVEHELIEAGEARRALDCIWNHFITRRALRNGMVTQGFYKSDSRLIDPYSGPASSLWSLRSLVMAFYYPPEHDFWTAEPLPLPVERQDYAIYFDAPKWHVRGDKQTSEITLSLAANSQKSPAKFASRSVIYQLKCFLGVAPRPKNLGPKYDRHTYSSSSLSVCDRHCSQHERSGRGTA